MQVGNGQQLVFTSLGEFPRMRVRQHGLSLMVEAPAKLNLFLELLGRRSDGFHDLESVFVSVNLYDRLVFEPVDSEAVSLRWGLRSAGIPADLPLDGRNLILRAAELLRRRVGPTPGVNIHLYKRIPVEAGLGGGSSNAAAALVGLNHFWKLNLAPRELHTLAAQLGSDVNFFLDSPVAALCRGRGEQVTPVELPGVLPLVIVKPPTGCSTAEVFRRVCLSKHPRSAAEFSTALQTGRMQGIVNLLHNALEAPAVEVNPEIGQMLALLRENGAIAAGMTGSGSACFGLCHSIGQAMMLARRLSALRLGQVFSVRTAI